MVGKVSGEVNTDGVSNLRRTRNFVRVPG